MENKGYFSKKSYADSISHSLRGDKSVSSDESPLLSGLEWGWVHLQEEKCIPCLSHEGAG